MHNKGKTITMVKSMFLVEVYTYIDPTLYRRRISENLYAIEDWLETYAQSWADYPIKIECDEYCNGTIKLCSDDTILYTFSTTNIKVL